MAIYFRFAGIYIGYLIKGRNLKNDPLCISPAFGSFDMEYFSVFKRETTPHKRDFLNILQEITGVSEEIMSSLNSHERVK